jgi:hypothetical protein
MAARPEDGAVPGDGANGRREPVPKRRRRRRALEPGPVPRTLINYLSVLRSLELANRPMQELCGVPAEQCSPLSLELAALFERTRADSSMYEVGCTRGHAGVPAVAGCADGRATLGAMRGYRNLRAFLRPWRA